MVLLDTNIVIAILNGVDLRVRAKLLAAHSARTQVGISSIVLFELWYGVARGSRKAENSNRISDFLSGAISVLDFDEQDAAMAGQVRQSLAAKGTPIGPYDILIAGQALRHGATLVTANTREFKRIAGLKLADWTRESPI